MSRTAPWMAALLASFIVLAAAPSAFAATDDMIPGDPLAASPMAGALDAATDLQDIYHVTLVAGETLVLSLTTDPALATPDCDLDIYVYAPGTVTAMHASAIAKATLPLYYPETISYTAPASGEYFVEIFAAEGAGPTSLAWQVVPEPLLPVFRFYNVRTGTHFYTPSDAERANVGARWPDVFRYEGVAYYTKATRNSQPLYRFYNRRSGSHFYTASVQERDTVIAQWSGVFTYEGETYRVTPTAEAGKTPVFRFYNVRNGSHFFTASVDEANQVMAQYSGVYSFEGPAFYLGQ